MMGVSSAQAYFPPSYFIVKSVAAKRSGLKSVKIISQVTGFDSSGKPNGEKFKVVTLYFPVTKLMKSQALDATTGTELFGMEKRSEALPLSLLVLYDPHSSEIASALKRNEIMIGSPEEEPAPGASPKAGPAESTYLKRWNGSVAWVLGTTPGKPKNDASELWIEKDSFLPVRILTSSQDIQFTKYRYLKDLPYPRTTTQATRSGTLEVQEDTTEVQVNFSTKSEPAGFANGFTDAGGSSSVKDLIRKYYAGLR